MPNAAHERIGAAGIRAHAEDLSHLQFARRSQRDLGHRTSAIYLARAGAREGRGADLFQYARGARISDVASVSLKAKQCGPSRRGLAERKAGTFTSSLESRWQSATFWL